MVLKLLPGTAWAEKVPRDKTTPSDTEIVSSDSLFDPEGSKDEPEDISDFDKSIDYEDITPLAESIDTPATSGTCGENLTWRFDAASGTLIISGIGPMDDYRYSSLAPWYYYNEFITSIVLEEGITSIGSNAFGEDLYGGADGSKRVTDVNIPSTVISIGEGAFAGCGFLESVTIPNSVTSIGDYAFSYTALISVTIPDGVMSIGKSAFLRSTLTSATISNSVNSMGEYVFCECRKLTNVNLSNSLPRIENGTFSGCEKLASINIPSSVISIGKDAFYMCYALDNVTLPDSVTSIEYGAFGACIKLTSITIPNSVTSIDGSAFFSCNSLTSITIPSSVTSINGVFSSGEKLTHINVDTQNANYASIDGVLFTKNKLHLLRYPAGKQGAYTIPSGVITIGENAFSNCEGLTNVTIPKSVTSIRSHAFTDCSSLTNVTIPNSVTSIKNGTFFRCYGLKNVTIPNSVTSIEDSVFYGCNSLTDVYYSGSENEWNTLKIMDEGNSSLLNATIHYNSTGPEDISHKAVSGVLRSGDDWKIRWECAYKEDADGKPCNGVLKITVKDTNTFDELYLYDDSGKPGFPWEREPYNIPKSAITDLFIMGCPTKHLILTANSFQGYTGLKSVVLNEVTGMDAYAFEGCTALEGVFFSMSDEIFANIGKGAFKNCKKLTNFSFPTGVKMIGAEAFQNTALSGTITLGTNIKEIGEDAFDGCENILIRCYKNSVAHQYAAKNNIPFELIGEASVKTIPFYSPTGNKTTEWDINWGWDLFQLPTYQYHHQLAALGMVLSAATEEDTSDRAENLYNYLGFEHVKSENYGSNFNFITMDGQFYPGVVFACHKENGNYTLAITVRGTNGNEWEDIITDISVQGFVISARNIYAQFNTFLKENGLSSSILKDKVKIFVTGHSLGGATANALTKILNDEYGLENVFVYTFAAPRPYTVWDAEKISNVYNAFNIVNEEDLVPKLKNVWTLQRVGNDLRPFHRDTTDGFYENFKLLTGRAFVQSDSAHDVAVYMAYILSHADGAIEPVQSVSYIVVRIACPVNIEVYNSNQELVGQVNDNQIINTSPDKIQIYVEGDEKQIVLIGKDDYSFKMLGTDTGSMAYSVYHVDGTTQKINSEKIFDRVALVDGKQFTSRVSVWDAADGNIDIADKIDVPEVKLYVLDENGEPEKEVLPDGNGTEAPIETPDNPPASCEHEYTATVTPPTCTERGYTTYTCGKCSDSYVDSYTAALGHNYGAWTVVVPATATANGRQERVCSRCGDKQTETILATGGGETNTPNYGFGGGSSGSSSPVTYNITISSVVGGTISVSPKSAAKGTVVTISAVPDTGYELISMTVLDSSGNVVALTDKGNGKYTFTMPSSKTTVNAVFQPIQPNTPEPDAPAENVWNNPYIDVVSGAWYYDAVEFISTNGLMNGTSNSIFEPDAPLSRAMLAQILYNKEGRPTVASNVFTDVADNAWYADAVAWAATQGIVGGYGNGLFGPDDNITREQLAVMLWRYAGKPAATSQELYFNDADTANGYAVDALCWAVEQGIINGHGNGQLGPQELATRAQVAQIFMNYLKK